MSSEALTDLAQILASLTVTRRGEYVYATVPAGEDGALPSIFDPDTHAILDDVEPLATVREAEGLTLVLPVEDAPRLAAEFVLQFDDVFTCLTLDVHSALTSVGLTAEFSRILADAGISCNVLAGFFHDHLLVPADRADDAESLLLALAERARAGE